MYLSELGYKRQPFLDEPNMVNPAKVFHRNCSIGWRGRFSLETVLEIVRATTDFAGAVSFFKMGFPLSVCMEGVGWPQNRYEPPSALFKPDNICKVVGCYCCFRKASKCCCFSTASTTTPPIHEARGITFREMYEDPEGRLWEDYTQSIEDGWNDQTYLVETFTDEVWEFSVARNLQGQIVAQQHAENQTGVRFALVCIDPLCQCGDGLIQHDAWEVCPETDFMDDSD